METMEVHSSGYIETYCCFYFQTFHFQFTMTFDGRHKNVSRSVGFFWCSFFFFFLATSSDKNSLLPVSFYSAMLFTHLGLLQFAYLICKSSLCNQDLNHVRLTQSPCEGFFFFNIININSMCSSHIFVLSKPKCQYSG